uniref:Uncharacterized protein n=1 Tax=Anguilla anguilla TaxID=7936 RepID=A0A0E9ULN7_ANGAN
MGVGCVFCFSRCIYLQKQNVRSDAFFSPI